MYSLWNLVPDFTELLAIYYIFHHPATIVVIETIDQEFNSCFYGNVSKNNTKSSGIKICIESKKCSRLNK